MSEHYREFYACRNYVNGIGMVNNAHIEMYEKY